MEKTARGGGAGGGGWGWGIAGSLGIWRKVEEEEKGTEVRRKVNERSRAGEVKGILEYDTDNASY